MKYLKHYTLLENKNEFYEEVDQSTFIDSILDRSKKFWECDQIEGLLSLLREEKVIR
jgi:hypothetical protein